MSSKPQKTLVVDLDGTLADTRLDLIPVLNRVTAQAGLAPIAMENVGHVVGHGAKAMIARAFAYHGKPLDDALHERLFEAFIKDYSANIAVETRIFDGGLAALETLKSEGWALAICTNKLEGLARQLLTSLDCMDLFSAVSGGDTFTNKKPHADHIIKTVELAGNLPAHAIMVGDTITDIDAARASRVPVIAASFGYSEIPVAELNPDAVIDHFDQLPQAARKIAASPGSGYLGDALL